MNSLVIATRNRHKVHEIRAILGDHCHYLTLDDFPAAPETVEDAPTFAGNATKKAVALARWLSRLSAAPARQLRHFPAFVLADDSGLEVDALGGAPGVHSARFAALDTGTAGNSPSEANNAKLLRLLAPVRAEKRTARFRCAVALTPLAPAAAESASPVCYADEFELQTLLCEGTCEGRLGFELRGRGGFGYDPLFFPAGYDQTFAELGDEVKNRLSHRAQALQTLRTKWPLASGKPNPEISNLKSQI